jgi:hypothetical protein
MPTAYRFEPRVTNKNLFFESTHLSVSIGRDVKNSNSTIISGIGKFTFTNSKNMNG